MYAREERHAFRRVLVVLLTLALLLSVCFPALQARADDTDSSTGETEATAGETAEDPTTGPAGGEETVCEPPDTPQTTDGSDADTYDDGKQPGSPMPDGENTAPSETASVSDDVPTEESGDVSSEESDESQTGQMPAEELPADETLTEEIAAFSMERPSHGRNELDPGSYVSTSVVYWDSMNSSESGSYSGANDARIAGIQLNGKSVSWGNSNARRWSGGAALSSYFPNASASSSTATMQSATLSITPAAGYYVTKIVIACVDPGSRSPYGCNTWEAGNAFVANFSVGTTGTASVTVSSLDFSHQSRSGNYFILVKLAPIPTPLYVEYDSGTVGKQLGGNAGSVFSQRDAWTRESTGNSFGIGGIQSEYTQYLYGYSGEPSQAGAWKHFANTVTAEAKREAAQIGYFFSGWRVEYYTTCTAQQRSNPGEGENNYTYSFSGSYGTGSAGEGEAVPLTTNCRIIAQWSPVTLTIVKETEGITGSHAFGLTLYRDGETVDAEHTLTVSGTGTASAVVSPVIPGAYSIAETNGGGNLAVGDVTLYHSVRYEPQQVSISVDDILLGTTHYELRAINTYSQAKPMLKFVKAWQNYDGTALEGDSSLLPDTVTYTVTGSGGYSGAVTLRKENGWTAVMEVPAEEAISGLTVTENTVTGFRQVGEMTVTTQPDDENQLVYTVYSATNRLCTASVTVKKTVTGNMGDRTKPFTFHMTVDGEPYVADFTLASGEEMVIEHVPIGSAVVITESGNDGYEFSAEVTNIGGESVNGSTVSFTVSPEGNCVTVTNRKEALIDTGVTVDFAPYILLLAAGLTGAAVVCRRRHW